jgi:diguanylate cyclase (GGDEF)-like protein
MNPFRYITKKRHAVVAASIIAVLACIGSLTADKIMLDPSVQKMVLVSNTISSLLIGFVISYFVGLKVAEVNILTVKLDYLASFDFLTGAMTRAKFFGQLSAMPNRSGAILVFDMDKFKLINDTLGHAAGDTALFKVAQATRKNLGPNDFLCRLGGDEFCAFFPDIDLAEAGTIAQWIQQCIANETVGDAGNSINLSASFGIAMLTSGADIDAAVAVADADLYHAKANNARSPAQMVTENRGRKSGRG